MAALLALAGGLARGQSVGGARQADLDLDLAVRRGRLATLAPLCGLRGQGWGEDLRKAAVQDATRAPTPDEPALKAAPDSDAAGAALGYAEAEALEDFATAPHAATCGPLARDPTLRDADTRVAAYRADLARAEHQY